MLSSLLTFGLYILIGLVLDFIITLHFRYVAEGKRLPATIFSILYLFCNFLVYDRVVREDSGDLKKLAYAIGAGLGTWLAMTAKIRKKDKT